MLDNHREALKEKEKEGEVDDLRRGMEDLSATGKTVTEEISRLKVDLDHKAVARSSREKELEQLKGS